jgi:uncharacterized membrane protein
VSNCLSRRRKQISAHRTRLEHNHTHTLCETPSVVRMFTMQAFCRAAPTSSLTAARRRPVPRASRVVAGRPRCAPPMAQTEGRSQRGGGDGGRGYSGGGSGGNGGGGGGSGGGNSDRLAQARFGSMCLPGTLEWAIRVFLFLVFLLRNLGRPALIPAFTAVNCRLSWTNLTMPRGHCS